MQAYGSLSKKKFKNILILTFYGMTDIHMRMQEFF